MKRRTLVNWIGVSTLAASLPVAIAACRSQSSPSSKSATDTPDASKDSNRHSAKNFIEIGNLDDLAQQGYLASADAFSEPIIIIQDPNQTEALIALSAKCTHSGCDVAWQEDLFACPCHGSKFNPDGSVVNGPATAPLTPYIATTEGKTVLAAAS